MCGADAVMTNLTDSGLTAKAFLLLCPPKPAHRGYSPKHAAYLSAGTAFNPDSATTVLQFTRKLSTGVAGDVAIDSLGQTTLLWAYGSSPRIGYHGNNKGHFTVVLEPYQYSRMYLQGRFLLLWNASVDSSSVSFAVRANSTGWVGLGFNAVGLDAPMCGGDAVMAWVGDDGTPVIAAHKLDCSNEQNITQMISDIAREVKPAGYLQNASVYSPAPLVTIVRFSRLVSTGGASDVPINVSAPITLLVGVGRTKSISEHKSSDKAADTVVLVPQCSCGGHGHCGPDGQTCVCDQGYSGPSCSPTPAPPSNLIVLTDGYTMSWTIDAAVTTITFTLAISKDACWAGIGLKSNQVLEMANSEFLVAQRSGECVFVCACVCVCVCVCV